MTVHSSVRNHQNWARLVELVHELAFIDGGTDDAFTLASGRQSRWFFDTKPVMMHPESTHLLGQLFNMRMDALGADFVGGLELGAVPLTAIAIATSSTDSPRRGFMVRKESKGRGGRKTNNPPGIEGSSLEAGGDIIIVEDVTTTGGSAIRAVERIHNDTSCQVIAVISIVDREEGAKKAFADAGIHFESILTRSDVAGI
ncbi:MAG: orotate phosphoribosyltransferase [Euryarchaeota archaeon]|uniref:Orotate phosphoribosyltransferase n=1 Tax=uncultured marine bacterium MedDCM-OCT-S05-C222 TaxID=743064 RepID=D6PDG3_9BACT|nr:orotate phosphoribosyltransferase [uncultured marine bacterium MedDCM-OCT-S05-C222]MAI40015.1 orotate phosphoribosyltransferase [Euryarchaeota archaeon]|tara:strand:+ start:1886 stop:2485 length:600 start_codon:yes stop_codon:yes gene_type:complete